MAYVFPENFVWGTATASYQVEGAIREGGRTPSIWDTFCDKPGTILDGSSGEQACDQYHRYLDDIEVMKKLGVHAYRMSISWSRIIPHDDGEVNAAGVEHYKKVLDAIHEAGLRTYVTLYHWDLPQYLEDKGGWASRETAYAFAQYARVLARELGSRVDVWITLNEPWCSAYLGYGNGVHAPGICDYEKSLRAVHHLNLAHGLGARAIYDELGDDVHVSIALNPAVNIAETDSVQDLEAKKHADMIANEVFYQPLFDGTYPQGLRELTAHITDWSFVLEGDLDIIHQPVSSVGLNYYATSHVVWRDDAPADSGTQGAAGRHPMPAQEHVHNLPARGELTAMGWNQEPEGLTLLLTQICARYPDIDFYISENGSAWDDEVVGAGDCDSGSEGEPHVHESHVHDPRRVNYLNEHVTAVARAIESGARVVGYFAWSLLDNFEWAYGYAKRFGIIYVDYETQQRMWKDSAVRYSQIVRSNSIE